MQDQLPMTFAADFPVTFEPVWRDLGERAAINPQWSPLDTKIFYVFGVLHDIFESVEYLVQAPNAWPVTYISAVGVFTSGVELLGRCVRGNKGTRENTENLRRGLQYLVDARLRRPALEQANDQDVLITSLMHTYTVEDLVAIRHFAAHGQAHSSKLSIIDGTLLEHLPTISGRALERYWNALRQDAAVCERMAVANVVPLGMRADPIMKILAPIRQGQNITNIFRAFNWTISYPLDPVEDESDA